MIDGLIVKWLNCCQAFFIVKYHRQFNNITI